MHEDVQKQLVDQANELSGEIRTLEAKLLGLKEHYLKIQGGLDTLNYINNADARKINAVEENNVDGTDS